MSQSKSRRKKGVTSPALTLVSVSQALLVGEYLSFRRVATVLGLRQSAVSRRVRELEDELGVSLFERHHAGVRVTNAGVRFLQEARAALLQLDHAVKTATTAGSGKIGRISIGILSSIGTGYLRELIQVYRSHHPDVGIQILESASADNVAAVRKRQLDMAFIMDTTDASGCETLPLWTERIIRRRPTVRRPTDAARAQQAGMPVVGLLNPTSPDVIADRVRGFRQGLKDTGYVEGENVAIEYRWADGQFDRLSALAAELVRRQPNVIVATGGAASAFAAKAATATIPVVFEVAQDPVRLGLVASLARPGGNVTGINFFSGELAAKRLELLRELVPGAARVAVLVNPSNAPNTETTLTEVEAAAGSIGLQIQIVHASTNSEINAAFETILRERPDALFAARMGFSIADVSNSPT